MPDWWGKREDACFLLGVYKHGMTRYDDIKVDPALCFYEKFQDASAAGSSGDADEVGDLDVYSGRRRAASRRSKKVIEWPQIKILNQRLKSLLRALETSLRKKRPILVIDSKRHPVDKEKANLPPLQLQPPKDEDEKLRKPVKEWSKREKQGKSHFGTCCREAENDSLRRAPFRRLLQGTYYARSAVRSRGGV